MDPITQTEFAAMERVLAELIDSCDPVEEAMLLRLHARLVQIQAAQNALDISRNRLTALQSQTAR